MESRVNVEMGRPSLLNRPIVSLQYAHTHKPCCAPLQVHEVSLYYIVLYLFISVYFSADDTLDFSVVEKLAGIR